MAALVTKTNVCVVGLGYIGLPTASLLASRGFQVAGVDINAKVVETINNSQAHIIEPDLDILVSAAVNSGRLKAYTTPKSADMFIIAVPTPFKDNHVPDLSYVESATMSIASHLTKGNTVILESTSPVGTTEKIVEWLSEKRPDLKFPKRGEEREDADIAVAYCPERVLPGHILKELTENDRIVGGIDNKSTVEARKFYEQIVKGKVFETDSRTAELSKLTENAYRDVNIAFANELSRICDQLNINTWELIRLANRHPRVKILNPGPGVGGHCIAVDPWFIVDSVPEHTQLIRTSRIVNDGQPHWVFEKLKSNFKQIGSRPIALLGLSYKPDIDDLRESPAIEVTKLVAQHYKSTVFVVEPHVESLPHELRGYSNLKLVELKYALEESSAVVILVGHTLFKKISKESLSGKLILDSVGILEKTNGSN